MSESAGDLATRLRAGHDEHCAFEEDMWEPGGARCTCDFEATIERAAKRLGQAQVVVDEQAEDEVLWCIAERISEAYLQQELRKLAYVVEYGIPEP